MDFAPASILSALLESAPSDQNWAGSAAEYVLQKLMNKQVDFFKYTV